MNKYEQVRFDNEFRKIIDFNAEHNNLIEDVVIPVAADDALAKMAVTALQRNTFMSEDIHKGYVRIAQKHIEGKYDLLSDTWPDVCLAVHKRAAENLVEGA